jgi:hypothetical protein
LIYVIKETIAPKGSFLLKGGERMSPLIEAIKPYEIKNGEGELATAEVALDFLNQLTEEVESGRMSEAVLATNLLQEGQRYPLLSGRLIKSLETDQGSLSVSEEIWLEALDAYFKELGLPVDFLFMEFKGTELAGETIGLSSSDRPNLSFQRVRDCDRISGDLTLLRLKIHHEP